jgi:hypothetical protein
MSFDAEAYKEFVERYQIAPHVWRHESPLGEPVTWLTPEGRWVSASDPNWRCWAWISGRYRPYGCMPKCSCVIRAAQAAERTTSDDPHRR